MTSLNKKILKADCIIIGAGIFGLQTARYLVKNNKKVIILEKGFEPFSRASAINQARVHNGYHYPRSYETAQNAAYYYEQFSKDFNFAINNSFKKIYAVANKNSKTSSIEFIKFCSLVNIPLLEIDNKKYFNKGSVEVAFIAEECSFDYTKIKAFMLREVENNSTFIYNAQIKNVKKINSHYSILLENGQKLSAPLVINTSYSGINEVIDKFHQELFDIKYELCEVAICKASDNLENVGITVVDGDFFSIMPFGGQTLHAFTSVAHTPHLVSYEKIPRFSTKTASQTICKMHHIKGCIICAQKLKSAWSRMHILSKEYLNPKYTLDYKYSLFEIKSILTQSEDDDSRPTLITKHTDNPTFISVLSGKLSTIYELENYLKNL